MSHNNNDSKKYIEKYHYYYAIGIALITIVVIFSFYFGGGDKAGNILGFAATLSSILLALIAILMTIVDLAGQRNTIADLKEVSKNLEENLNTANKGIEEIGAIKEELLSSMKTIISSNMVVSKEITELKAKYSVSEESGHQTKDTNNKDILADLNTLSNKMETVYFKDIPVMYNYRKSNVNSNINREMSKQISSKLKSDFIKNVEYEFKDFVNYFNSIEDFYISRSRLKHELNRLVSTGEIVRIDNKYYKIINIK